MDVSIKAGLSFMAVCVTLAGCAGITDPTVGKGPIALSADAEAAFAEYQSERAPRYFAVSTDGQAYYYSFCNVGRCLRQAKTQVIDKCQSFSNGIPCKIYASMGQVVWQQQDQQCYYDVSPTGSAADVLVQRICP